MCPDARVAFRIPPKKHSHRTWQVSWHTPPRGLVEIGPQTSEVLYCYKLRKDFDCQIGDASFDRRR